MLNKSLWEELKSACQCKDKVDQLVTLYGCTFMSGRAKSAPLLKKKDGYDSVESNVIANGVELNVLDDIDESGVVVVPEADFHDLNVWPHLHSEELMHKLFPTAVAAPAVDNVSPQEADELGRLHRRWAAKKIEITFG